MRIFVVGIGPGSPEDVTPAVQQAISQSDVVVGYRRYFPYIAAWVRHDAECVDTGMKHEKERAEQAFLLAEQGKTVCVISSGDAGIYGMTSLIYEMKRLRGTDVEIIPLPGISAFQKAASLLGAPVSHDFCVISLSNLMTPWAVIERRIRAAASADFVTAVYNPRSNERYWQLPRLKEVFLQFRSPDTVVGVVRQAGREGESVAVTTLQKLNPEDVDMFTIIIIGNSQSYAWKGHFITPRGYYSDEKSDFDWAKGEKEAKQDSPAFSSEASHVTSRESPKSVGQGIMMKSFMTIRKELHHPDIPLWRLWPLLHTIHTTADFQMERLLWMDEGATAGLYDSLVQGKLTTVITDVTMVKSGIRRGAVDRWGLTVECWLDDARAVALAQSEGLTRSQAGIRLAAEAHPEGALFAIGNAPTALLELCSLVRKGRCRPVGVIGAPVGFVHVEESKHAAKTLSEVPKILIEGRKGGSSLAATLVNSILTYDDASALAPGRFV